MIYALLGLIVLVSLAIGLYCSMKNGELKGQVAALGEQIEDQEEGYAAELERVRAELAKLSKYAQIPDVLDRAKKTEEQIAAKLEKAEREASEVMREARHEAETIRDIATREAERQKAGVLGEIEEDQTRAREARRIAEWQANNIVDEARKQAKEIASQARKEAREKTQKVAEVLSLATAYATQIRSAAERRAEEIAGNAYRALERHDHYRAAVKAMENALSGYKDVYAVPGTHVLDELADEYAFHRAGESLKLARQRTRIMMENGLAASCNYPEGWKRDYAIEFVLGAFNGKVDALLARVRPAQHGKLAQEIKDAYAVVNHNGEVFRNTQINEEFLDSRLEEPMGRGGAAGQGASSARSSGPSGSGSGRRRRPGGSTSGRSSRPRRTRNSSTRHWRRRGQNSNGPASRRRPPTRPSSWNWMRSSASWRRRTSGRSPWPSRRSVGTSTSSPTSGRSARACTRSALPVVWSRPIGSGNSATPASPLRSISTP